MYIYPIDLVRFFAATVVAFFHITYSVWANPSSGGKIFAFEGYEFPILGNKFSFGWIGVEIFFVISGFVIANTSVGSTPWRYFRSRFLRLYPAVWTCASISLIFVLLAGGYEQVSSLERYIRSISLFPLHPWIDPAYWTLPVEIAFYGLVFCLILLGKSDKLVPFSILLLTLSGTYQLIILMKNFGYIDFIPRFPLQVSRLLMLDFGSFFAVGMLIWLRNKYQKSRHVSVLIFIACVICAVEIYNHVSATSRSLTHEENLLKQFSICFGVWGICVLVILNSDWLNNFGFFQNKHTQKFTRRLGLMTFPIYLLHFVVGVSLVRIFQSDLGLSRFIALGLSICFIFVASYLICTVIEPKLRTITSRLLDKFHAAANSAFLGEKK